MLVFSPPLIISLWEPLSYTLCRKDSEQTTSKIAGMPELLPKSALFLLVKALVFKDVYWFMACRLWWQNERAC